jgi:hypothetical protein
MALLYSIGGCTNNANKAVILRIDGAGNRGSGMGAQVEQFADVDGDGVPEIMAAAPYGGPGTLVVFSGATGNVVYTIDSELNKYYLKVFTFVPDLNEDGIEEIAAPDTGSGPGLWVFSGKDGAPLFEMNERLYIDEDEPPRVLSVPDKNSDGVIDLALEQRTRNLIVFSGKDGSKITELDPPATFNDHVLYHQAPDIDGDGYADILGFTSARRQINENRFRMITRAKFLSSADFRQIGDSFDILVDQRPHECACADLNGDGTPDVVASHSSGGLPQGSVLLAVSGKDGRELWRVNGIDVQGGSHIMGVDAKTGEVVSSYTDVGFGHAIALLPDVNGDGVPDVATGHTKLFDRESRVMGQVHVFSGKDGALLKKVFSPDNNSVIGMSIAPFADANFDGTPDILTGIPGATANDRKEVGGILVMAL